MDREHKILPLTDIEQTADELFSGDNILQIFSIILTISVTLLLCALSVILYI